MSSPPQLVTDLDGKLPGGGKDQPLHLIVFGVDVLDHGDAEGEGLAGACGGFGDDILPLHELGDGFGLNGGGVAVPLFLKGFQHRLAQAKLIESNCSIRHNSIPFPYGILLSFYQFFRIFATIVPVHSVKSQI